MQRQKYVYRLAMLIIIVFQSRQLSLANELDYISNQEDLLVAKGAPSEQWQFEDQGALFEHYYYQTENASFLIDQETGLICKQYQGKSRGSCYPCEKDQVSTKCP